MTPDDLRAFRTEHRLSQSGLARLLPVSLDTLQNWEIARAKPPPYLDRALRDLDRELSQAPSS